MAYYMEAFALLAIAGFLLYRWSTSKYKVWQERGIPHEKPWPIIGTISWKVFLAKSSFMKEIIDVYMKFDGKKLYGIYSFGDPVVILRDLELIKKVGIKDFDSFSNHKNSLNLGNDNIFTKTLVALRDRRWKGMRHTLTPSFTGNKMRLMYELVNECCIEAVQYIDGEIKHTGKNELDLEMKEYFTRYTNDVIASTAFGLKVNSFKDKTNDFYTIGRTLTQFRVWIIVKSLLMTLFPKLMKLLRVQLMDEKNINYFKQLVTDAIKYRKEHNIVRPDMIHLLLEAQRNAIETKTEEQTGDHAQFNDEDLLAQCFIFFLAGFETVSQSLCFTIHELVVNPEVQQRLYDEVWETEKGLNGKPLDYDTLMKMKYLDMVFSESLRKWPPAVMTDRECSNDYRLTDEEGNLVADIKKNDSVFIPIVGLHYDPKHFQNPDKFDPERFSEENKHNINPMAYLPFGVGPRNCIGNRFALMEAKSIIYHFVLRFKLVPAEKTVKDMMSALKGFQMQPKEKFWIKFLPREH